MTSFLLIVVLMYVVIVLVNSVNTYYILFDEANCSRIVFVMNYF